MKKSLFLLLCFLMLCNPSYAQAVSIEEGKELLREIPREKIFMHYNSSILFSGEYLYYKIYNLESETGKFSEISKIANIELVGKDGKVIFSHKILLKNGQGQGDFFIPTTVPSGNYKLLAYTTWMRNDRKIFSGDLAIINPYRGDQSAISGSFAENSSENKISSKSITSGTKTAAEGLNDLVKIITKNDTFQSREKVVLKFEGASGRYSLSVRIKDSIDIPQRFTSVNFDRPTQNINLERDSVFLPEMRGNLISGKIIPDESPENRRLSGEKVAFSIPGEDFIFRIATTDSKGRFYINLDEHYEPTEALMQILGENSENFSIQVSPLSKVDVANLNFGDFQLNKAWEPWILDRSVSIQIENAYYSAKPDTLQALEKIEPFYVKQPKVYDLDAYTRFPTIKETFVEIIQFSWISTDRTGDSRIIVRQPQGAINFNLPTLLLVDGVMVQDHNLFMNYPAKKVKTINILRDNFFLGSHIFSGIVDVKTIEGDFAETLNNNNIQLTSLKPPERDKSYFKQTYEEQTQDQFSRIPDLRTQLLWEPTIEIDSQSENLEFYTSDLPGTFEIHLEGFTRDGKPVSVKKEIVIQP